MSRARGRDGGTRESRHWDDPSRNPQSLGCASCPDRKVCGGLYVRSAAFDCTSYCCGKPASCDVVCRLNPNFVHRMWEVGGFGLSRVVPSTTCSFPELPVSVPLIYGRAGRQGMFAPRAVGLVLYQLINRSDGTPKFSCLSSLYSYFGIQQGTPIVLSGTDEDRPIERWWNLGERRRELLRWLTSLGIAAATTPNYSLFSDVPRWDNLHAMKRIAIAWQEMVDSSLPAALHVNARTNRDWQRWTDFIRERPEVSAIAYEFATGAAGRTRMASHVHALRSLADAVSRPLTLVMRGAFGHLGELSTSFARVTLIDSTTHMKTVHRVRGTLSSDGRVRWRPSNDRPDVDLDSLLENNYLTMVRAAEMSIQRSMIPVRREAS